MNILNELRKGNIVDLGSRIAKIQEIYHNSCSVLDLEETQDTLEGIERIKPLKLTPEWILKAGFVKKEKSPVEYELKINKHLIYEVRWNRLNQEIHSLGVVITSDEGENEGMVNFAWNIEYVHSFQNIMFGILKKEIY